MDVPREMLVALRQQLCADFRLGIDSIPLPPRLLQSPGLGRGDAPGKSDQSATPTESRHTAVERTQHPRGRLAPPAERARPIIRSNSDPIIGTSAAADRLRLLNEEQVKNCRKCPLCETRTQTVFGQGTATPRLVFVGEAPGYDEDKQGLAFVGAAGQLLTKMIAAMGLSRDDVFICNVLKCRPPGNRTPTADEILACSPYLGEQLECLSPEVIVALGAPAAKTLLNTAESIGRLRGRWHEYRPSGRAGDMPAIAVMPTYHPAYLLRTPGDKKLAWSDLQMVMARLGL